MGYQYKINIYNKIDSGVLSSDSILGSVWFYISSNSYSDIFNIYVSFGDEFCLPLEIVLDSFFMLVRNTFTHTQYWFYFDLDFILFQNSIVRMGFTIC